MIEREERLATEASERSAKAAAAAKRTVPVRAVAVDFDGPNVDLRFLPEQDLAVVWYRMQGPARVMLDARGLPALDVDMPICRGVVARAVRDVELTSQEVSGLGRLGQFPVLRQMIQEQRRAPLAAARAGYHEPTDSRPP